MNLTEVMKALDLEIQKKDKIQNLKIIVLELEVKKRGHTSAIKTHFQEISNLNNEINLITSEIISTLEGMIKC